MLAHLEGECEAKRNLNQLVASDMLSDNRVMERSLLVKQ